MPQQPAQPGFVEKLFKPFMDYLGLNGAAALTASRQQQQQQQQQQQPTQQKPPPINEDQLRKQGWTEKDIAWYRETQKIGK